MTGTSVPEFRQAALRWTRASAATATAGAAAVAAGEMGKIRTDHDRATAVIALGSEEAVGAAVGAMGNRGEGAMAGRPWAIEQQHRRPSR